MANIMTYLETSFYPMRFSLKTTSALGEKHVVGRCLSLMPKTSVSEQILRDQMTYSLKSPDCLVLFSLVLVLQDGKLLAEDKSTFDLSKAMFGEHVGENSRGPCCFQHGGSRKAL